MGCSCGRAWRRRNFNANHLQCKVEEGWLFLKSLKVLGGETEQDVYFRVPRIQCGPICQRKRPEGEERGARSTVGYICSTSG